MTYLIKQKEVGPTELDKYASTQKNKIYKASPQAYENLHHWIKNQGYDSVIIPKGSSPEFEHQNAYIALDPTQIKSATGNIGTYDPSNPDIRRNKGGNVEGYAEGGAPQDVNNGALGEAAQFAEAPPKRTLEERFPQGHYEEFKTLPLEETNTGIHFNPHAGLMGKAIDAATLPGDVVTGKVDPRSEEGLRRTVDLAGMATMGAGAAPAEENALNAGIRAYHGSPHKFDKFDISKIGTGEGAQVYGHGLYFVGNEGVAKRYRDVLSEDRLSDAELDAKQALDASGWNKIKAIKDIEDKIKRYYDNSKYYSPRARKSWRHMIFRKMKQKN
jgi:hypothetical protein